MLFAKILRLAEKPYGGPVNRVSGLLSQLVEQLADVRTEVGLVLVDAKLAADRAPHHVVALHQPHTAVHGSNNAEF